MIQQVDKVGPSNGPVKLIETKKVLVRLWTGDEYVTFGQIDEDNPKHRVNHLYLSHLDWQDMGYPETITVSVVPGDALNEE